MSLSRTAFELHEVWLALTGLVGVKGLARVARQDPDSRVRPDVSLLGALLVGPDRQAGYYSSGHKSQPGTTTLLAISRREAWLNRMSLSSGHKSCLLG